MNRLEDEIINIKVRLSELEVISVYGLSLYEIEERKKLEERLKKLEKQCESQNRKIRYRNNDFNDERSV